jgi:ribosomal protein L21
MANGDDTSIGSPSIEGASVSATVLEHLKGDKVLVFKKKRRKRYRVNARPPSAVYAQITDRRALSVN